MTEENVTPKKSDVEIIKEFRTKMLSLVMNRLADVSLPPDIRKINESIKDVLLGNYKPVRIWKGRF